MLSGQIRPLEQTMHGAGDLWVPGKSLDPEFRPATSEKLQSQLSNMLGNVETTGVDGVLGAIRVPRPGENIRGIVSLDLCEVVRKTAFALSTTAGKGYHGRTYMDGLWDVPEHIVAEITQQFDNPDDPDTQQAIHEAIGRNYVDPTVRAIVQVMVNGGHIKPVEGFEEIADMLTSWRESGLYVVANTSVAAGCEEKTNEFLDENFPNGVDGSVFPGNHDGKGRIKKADALGFVVKKLESYGQRPRHLFIVDDTPRHNKDIINRSPVENVRGYVPLFNHQTVALAGLSNSLFGAIKRPGREERNVGFEIDIDHVQQSLEPFSPAGAERVVLPMNEYSNVSHGKTPLETLRIMNAEINEFLQAQAA